MSDILVEFKYVIILKESACLFNILICVYQKKLGQGGCTPSVLELAYCWITFIPHWCKMKPFICLYTQTLPIY